MTPRQFEDHCADILASVGWSARVIGASGDQGADIKATRAGVVLVVQCKLHSAAVGNKAVMEVYAAQAHYRATAAVVVTTSGFTRAAKALASTTRVYLLAPTQLRTFIKPPAPPPPAPKLSVSMQFCRCLKHIIRLPAGRMGTVKCPHCGDHFHAVT